jgi:hypothetical protein
MTFRNFSKRWSLLLIGLAVLSLLGQAVYSQSDGGRVLLDITSGNAVVTSSTSGLKDGNAVVDKVWVSVSFGDPARAHAIVVVLGKGDDEAEVNLILEGRYARGSTTEFKGRSVVGDWKIRVKGETLSGIGIYLTIDCDLGSLPTPPTVLPAPIPTTNLNPVVRPPVRPTPPPSGGDITITPEIQFQALTRILIRKGVISAPELAEEIQRVARER